VERGGILPQGAVFTASGKGHLIARNGAFRGVSVGPAAVFLHLRVVRCVVVKDEKRNRVAVDRAIDDFEHFAFVKNLTCELIATLVERDDTLLALPDDQLPLRSADCAVPAVTAGPSSMPKIPSPTFGRIRRHPWSNPSVAPRAPTSRCPFAHPRESFPRKPMRSPEGP